VALIDTEEAARRLGRAILADIQLYNADTIAAGGDLGPVIAEGRELFRARVVPALHPVFEQMLDEAPFRGHGAPPGAPAPVAPPAPPLDSSQTGAPWVGLAALLVVLGVVLYVLLVRGR
jgi:hypothetical protein